ncbi:hypothetical protein V8C37DRAFT_418600 [Trichoderma ceciliae]
MSYKYNFPTTLKDMEPGDETGIYYITICNLAFNSTWRELKDWLSESCPVDFVEVFAFSCSGWIRLQGKENFEKALARIESEPFRNRPLTFDARNETEAVKIKTKESGPKPRHVKKNWLLAGRKQGRRMPSKDYSRQMQSPPYCSIPFSKQVRRRTRSLADIEAGDAGAADVMNAVSMLAFNDFLALTERMFSMSLHETLPMPYYAPPPFAFPCYDGGYHNNMNACAICPLAYGGVPMPPYPQPGVVMPGDVGDDTQHCLGSSVV